MFLLIQWAFCNFPNLAEFLDTAPLNYLKEMNQHKHKIIPLIYLNNSSMKGRRHNRRLYRTGKNIVS